MACALGWVAPSALAATGDINTVAGNGFSGYAGDGGQATSAQMMAPAGVAFGAAGDLFIADFYAHTVRKVAPGGVITTAAGTGAGGYGGDGGPATSALLNQPGDVVTDAAGNLYIADYGNSRVRKVGVNGIITTFAGTGTPGYSGDGGPAVLARLGNPVGLDIDSAGNLYVADFGNHTVRRITPGGVISTVAGRGFAGYSGDGGPATLAAMSQPGDVAVDGAGNVFIAEFSGQRVRKVTAAGIISTVAGTGVQGYSGTGGPATSAQLSNPAGVDVDSTGRLFIAEFGNHVVRAVSPSGTITRVAGIAFAGFSGDGGPAVSAQLDSPSRVTLSPNGDFYISDFSNSRVRYVDTLGALDAPSLTATSPASPASSNSPRVIGSAPSGSTVRLYTNSTCTSGVAAAGSAANFDSPGLSVTVPDDSTTTFYATATDSGTNVSGCSSSSITYVEDSTPPAAPSIGFGPISPGNDVTPDWSFSAEAGASTECRLVRETTIFSDWAACSSPKSYDLSGAPDGNYTFEVRQIDAAGNMGPAAARTYQLDTSAPPAPSIGSSPPSADNDATPTWGFSGEAGASVECRLERGSAVVSDWAPCASPRTYDLSAEPDGDYTFSARQTDPAGNQSPAATDGYLLDRSAPGAPTIDSMPPSPSSSTSPEWGFSGETGTSFECRLASLTAVVSDWGPCSSPQSYDLSGQSDGSYTFSVRQTDAAGNTSSSANAWYTLDRAAPAAPSIDSRPPSPSSGAQPEWGFSAEAGASTECRLTRGATTVSSWSACTSPRAYDLGAEPDGTYTFSVRAVDALGRTGPDASDAFELDRTAPGAPSLSATPGGLGNDSTPTWDFSSDAGTTSECRLERAATAVSDWQTCAGSVTYDLSGAPDGQYRFRVRSSDAAGNLGPESSSDYELDRVAPPAPSVDSGPGASGSTRTPEWGFTGEPGAVHECRLSRPGAVISDWTACASPAAFDLAGEPDDTYTFEARGRDGAGNTGSAAASSYRLDTVGAEPTIEEGPGPVGNDATPSWAFVGEPGARFDCTLERDGAPVLDWTACTSPFGADLGSEPDGAYAFRVRARDESDNVSAPVSYDYVLDRVAPGAPVFTAGPGELGNDVTPRWALSADRGAVVECRRVHEGTAGAWTACAGEHTLDLAATGDGAYALAARATDAAGNTSAIAESAYRLDATAPDAPAITDDPGARGRRRTVSWAFSGEPAATFECRLSRGKTTLEEWAPCLTRARYDLSAAPAGELAFRVRSRDRAGNLGPAARSAYELLPPSEEEESPPNRERREDDGPTSPGDPESAPEPEGTPAAPPSATPDGPAASGASSPPSSQPEDREPREDRPRERDRSGSPGTSIPLGEDELPPGDGVAIKPRPDVAAGDTLGERLFGTVGDAFRWVGRNLDKTGFPLLLLLLVLGYTAIQNRLDGRDPKLALAPVHADRDLEFLPPGPLGLHLGARPGLDSIP